MLLVEGLGRLGVEQRLLARGPLLDRAYARPWSPVRLLRDLAWCDLVHAHDAGGHRWAAAFAGRKPIVVSRRVAFPLRRGLLSGWKRRRATIWLAVSRHVRERLIEGGVDAGQIEVVYDGLPPPAQEPLFQPASEQPTVLIVDSEDPLKLTDLAVSACRRAGLPMLRTSNLEADLPRAGAFLYLTASEGLGSALIRASFAKKAIVASDVGGVPEIIEHERTGLLTANEVEGVAASLRRFVREPALARDCAEAAFRQAEERFHADIMVARTIEAYRRVLASASPA